MWPLPSLQGVILAESHCPSFCVGQEASSRLRGVAFHLLLIVTASVALTDQVSEVDFLMLELV